MAGVFLLRATPDVASRLCKGGGLSLEGERLENHATFLNRIGGVSLDVPHDIPMAARPEDFHRVSLLGAA